MISQWHAGCFVLAMLSSKITQVGFAFVLSLSALACTPQKQGSTLDVSEDPEADELNESKGKRSGRGPSGSAESGGDGDGDEGSSKGEETEEKPESTDPPAKDSPPGDTEGADCAALRACCQQVAAAGYSDAFCMGIVAEKDENTCAIQHANYKDAGDCQ